MRTERGTMEYTWHRADGEEIPVELHYTATPGRPAITGGPSDNWAPEEAGEVEITAVVSHEGLGLEFDDHLETHREEIERLVWEDIAGRIDAAREDAWEADRERLREEEL